MKSKYLEFLQNISSTNINIIFIFRVCHMKILWGLCPTWGWTSLLLGCHTLLFIKQWVNKFLAYWVNIYETRLNIMFSLENSHDISGFLIRITFSSFVLYKSYTDISLDNQGFSNSWSILTSEFRVQARLILQCRSYFSLPISVPSSYLLKKMQWLFLSRNSQNSSCGLCKKLWLLIPCDEDDIENNDDTSIVHYPIPDFHVFSVSRITTNYLPRYLMIVVLLLV